MFVLVCEKKNRDKKKKEMFSLESQPVPCPLEKVKLQFLEGIALMLEEKELIWIMLVNLLYISNKTVCEVDTMGTCSAWRGERGSVSLSQKVPASPWEQPRSL